MYNKALMTQDFPVVTIEKDHAFWDTRYKLRTIIIIMYYRWIPVMYQHYAIKDTVAKYKDLA